MNRAITISREYGSGGREIGEKLARRLGIPFYDKELIAMIAKEGNIETSVLEANDEVDPDFDNYSPRQVPPDYQIAMTQRIYAAQATVIRNLNDRGRALLWGAVQMPYFRTLLISLYSQIWKTVLTVSCP